MAGKFRSWSHQYGVGTACAVSVFLAAEWARQNGIGVLNWLNSPWFFAAVATIVIQSLAAYATHVFYHSSSWLWRFHRVHHFDTAVDVSTGLRHHPLELFLTLLIDSAVAVAFGLLPFALMMYGIAEAMFALFSHANIRLPGEMDRTLRVILVTPRSTRCIILPISRKLIVTMERF